MYQYDVGADGGLSPKATATVAAGNTPVKVAVSPDGGSVYVTNALGDNVSQYDVGAGGGLSPKAQATVAAGSGPFGLAVSPGTQPYEVTAELGLSDTSQCLLTQDYALQPDTEYTVRLCARDASHERWNCGGNRTFTTDPVP